MDESESCAQCNAIDTPPIHGVDTLTPKINEIKHVLRR